MNGTAVTLTEPAKGIFLLQMHNADNRMNPTFFGEFNAALDVVQRASPIGFISMGRDRFYSNGLDLDFLYSQKGSPLFRRLFPDHFYPLLRRILVLGCYSVAIVNGHAYAGGMALALAHDACCMAGGKGFKMCMNEIALGAPIPPGLLEVVRTKLPSSSVLAEAVLTPVAFNETRALQAGLVGFVANTEEELLRWAVQTVRRYAQNTGDSMGLLKSSINGSALAALGCRDDVPLDWLFPTNKPRL